jgi:hypothetical protein
MDAQQEKTMKYLMIDLYTGESELIARFQKDDMIGECELVEGDHKVWKCEEYMIVEMK